MLFTWCMLAAFILFLAPKNLTNKFQLTFARIFSLPLSISRNVSLSARPQSSLTNLVSRREYNKLQNHHANLVEELFEKHKKLEKLAGLRDRFYALEGANLMPADVSRSSIDRLRAELIINRGQNDGLAEGQFVLGDNSIVGTISKVSARTAQVKLLTDPTSRIEIKITPSNIERVLEGTGSNSARIRMINIKHKLKVGYEVKALKKTGLLDAPIIVGKVARCERDSQNPSIWDITVEPCCDIQRLKNVAVIIMNPQ